jgi:hypothetical protein
MKDWTKTDQWQDMGEEERKDWEYQRNYGYQDVELVDLGTDPMFNDPNFTEVYRDKSMDGASVGRWIKYSDGTYVQKRQAFVEPDGSDDYSDESVPLLSQIRGGAYLLFMSGFILILLSILFFYARWALSPAIKVIMSAY